MADFRRWVLALAVLALIVAPASAQLTCNTTGVPHQARAEGIAELLGDLVLVCEGPNAGAAIQANVTVFLSVPVTSRPVGTGLTLGSVTMPDNTTEALLLIDETVTTPVAPGVQGNTYLGVRSGQSLVFNNIIFPAVPGATSRTIRVTNLRGQTSAVSGSTIPGLTGQITATISIAGNQPISVTNPTAIVANVQTGLAFDRRSATFGSFDTIDLRQCLGRNTGTGTLSSSGGAGFTLRYSENFPTAFRLRIASGGDQTAIPALQFQTESGLTIPGVDDPGDGASSPGPVTSGLPVVGRATQPTRFFARFSGVPSGVTIYVTVNSLERLGAATDASAPIATLVGFDPGASGYVQPIQLDIIGGTATRNAGVTLRAVDATSGSVTGSSATSVTVAAVPVPLSGGSGSAVWEVRNLPTTLGSTEQIHFGVFVSAAAGTPTIPAGSNATPFANVAGGFAPVNATLGTTNTTVPVPRFADVTTTNDLFRFVQCVTNLLFPFVTNQAGFDTGIAVVNTSLDEVADDLPFSSHAQSGTCTFYFFGQGPAGGAAPGPQTTAEIAAGSMVAFSLQGGTIPGTTTTGSNFQGFQGYIIARCNFQFAHGFAFITRVGVSELAHGYLALVLPDTDRGGTEALAQ